MHHFPFCVCLRNSLDYPWPARGPPQGGARRLSAACRRSTARGRGRSGPSTPTHPRSPGQGVNDFCSSIISKEKKRSDIIFSQIIAPCLRTDALGEVELALAVETEDVLEYPRRSVEVELPTHQTERVTKAENLG